MPVTPIPSGYHTATPYLIVSDGPGAIEFYVRGLGATEISREAAPDGHVMHAELRIGDSMLMLGEHPGVNAPAPTPLPALSLYLHVEDADELHRRAVAAGARELSPVTTKFYGNREGGVEDPFGVTWWIATRVEDVPPEELTRRVAVEMTRRERERE
ncbi:MAG: VOC family protein [Acidobacteriota bacterium]